MITLAIVAVAVLVLGAFFWRVSSVGNAASVDDTALEDYRDQLVAKGNTMDNEMTPPGITGHPGY